MVYEQPVIDQAKGRGSEGKYPIFSGIWKVGPENSLDYLLARFRLVIVISIENFGGF